MNIDEQKSKEITERIIEAIKPDFGIDTIPALAMVLGLATARLRGSVKEVEGYGHTDIVEITALIGLTEMDDKYSTNFNKYINIDESEVKDNESN